MPIENRNEYALRLHRRLLDGDPVAPAEVIEAFLDDLVLRVRARVGPVRDEFLVIDAATDAFFAYVQDPSKFDPSKSGLLTYLTMSARGDFLNMLSRRSRQEMRQVPIEIVEHTLFDGNELIEELEERLDRERATSTGMTPELFEKVREAFPDPIDRKILSLMIEGERRTSEFAALLGIEDHDNTDQKRTVKRHKDRITKRLQRLGGRIHE